MIKKLLPIFFIIVLSSSFNENAFSDQLSAYDVLKNNSKIHEKNTLLLNILGWYQKKISPLNGPRCMFYPTCSDFFKEAVIKYGPLSAILMTIDRMFYRENSQSMRHYMYLRKYERYFDPIENNNIFIEKFNEK